MEAIGPILFLASIPMMMRWVPLNRVYGFRIPATLRDKSVWYDANALCGRHMFLLGLLMMALEFVLPRAALVPTLKMVGLVGFLTLTVVDWRTANRWARERAAASGQRP